MAAVAPDQLFVEFDVNSPESLRTINFEGESLYRKSNEYNISVFNEDGTPAQGIIQGIITLNAYSPGADRARTTANTVDLSSGCRKFDLFFATIERAVFSVAGLVPGLTVRVEAFRTRGLVVGSNDLNTLDPVNLRQWTPNYTGAGFVTIPEWSPAGDHQIDFNLINRANSGFLLTADNLISRIYIRLGNRLAIGNTLGNFPIASGVNKVSLLAVGLDVSVSINNIEVGTVTHPPNRVTAPIDFIGREYNAPTSVQRLDGQIYNLRLTDLDTPSNSRFYPGLITSATRPTTTVLVDELGPMPVT